MFLAAQQFFLGLRHRQQVEKQLEITRLFQHQGHLAVHRLLLLVPSVALPMELHMRLL